MSNLQSRKRAIAGETVDDDRLPVLTGDELSVCKDAEEDIAAELSILDEAPLGPKI